MTDRPIIFSEPMVRALLDGRKTQTRRVLKPQPEELPNGFAGCRLRYALADRLYVREAWRARLYNQDVPPRDLDPWATRLHYDADGTPPECDDGTNWQRARPSIHMPRWISRLTLTVTDVRVQRLQDISEADARAEGAKPDRGGGGMAGIYSRMGVDPYAYARGFRDLWNSLHGPDAWDANPWVVALTFTVRHGNIDTLEQMKGVK